MNRQAGIKENQRQRLVEVGHLEGARRIVGAVCPGIVADV
jgi:hypothetical protein